MQSTFKKNRKEQKMSYTKIDKNKFMTLENTVDELIDAVNLHYDVDRVLADFGIRVLGTVNRTNDIPGYIQPPYNGNFGDAYLVSLNSDSSAPYDTYIWTRKTPDSVEPDGYWLNIGAINVMGPQGETGPKGDPGPQGENVKWYVFKTLPQSGNFRTGDMCLLANGDIYMYDADLGWNNASHVNIKGPQGSPGNNGETPKIGSNNNWWIGDIDTGISAKGKDGSNGVPGTAILIQGKLSSPDLLPPDPSTAPRNYGYLISINNVVYLYFIAGIEGEEKWDRIEYSGNGTIVSTDGIAQSNWDTNTKVSKVNIANNLYATDKNGNQTTVTYSQNPTGNTIPLRVEGGHINLPTTPTKPFQAAPRKYVDDIAATKMPKVNTELLARNYIYGTTDQGNTTTAYWLSSMHNPYTIPQRGENGVLYVGTPTADNHAANKKYVDDAIASAGSVYKTEFISKSGTLGANTRLNMTDLPGIVPGTQVTIHAKFDPTGVVMGPPPVMLSVGNTNLATSGISYMGIPPINPNWNQAFITVFNDGINFVVQTTGPNQAYTVEGTFMDIGITDGTGGQTTLYVTYTKRV